MAERPTDGDVLITTILGNHFISVVPYPHRLTFGSLSDAHELARRWARAHDVSIWHAKDGDVVRLPSDEPEAVQ